jgi:steroid delta-isomerase-like uncharacterized protein
MAATAPREASIDIVREFNRTVFNGRDYDEISEFQAEDYVQHGPMGGQELHGNDESLANMKIFHSAFSDLEATEDFAFSNGEYVCTHYTYQGTHDGDLMGIPATNQPAEVRGMVVNRIADDKIAEAWVVVDFLSLFQQVGLVPDVDEFAS